MAPSSRGRLVIIYDLDHLNGRLDAKHRALKSCPVSKTSSVLTVHAPDLNAHLGQHGPEEKYASL